MMLPLAVPIALLGAVIGHCIVALGSRRPGDLGKVALVLVALLPTMVGAEHVASPEPLLFTCETSVVVDAPPETVWRNVVSFSDLDPPDDWVFRTGVAYPIRARIEGNGVGAVRRCEFSTGAFVEPIEVWDEPRLLRFAVTSNPAPMREWNPLFEIHPPHLDGFLVSKRGQFQLTPLRGREDPAPGEHAVPARPVAGLVLAALVGPDHPSDPRSGPEAHQDAVGVAVAPRAWPDGHHESEESMHDRSLSIDGVRVPRFLYGTAWKEDETQRLTELALRAGFRGIDTANQRRHYHEAAVGQAVAARDRERPGGPRATCSCRRSSPSARGRTTACPTTPTPRSRPRSSSRSPARSSTWARTSIDSYVLHGPSRRSGLARPTGRRGGRWRRSTTSGRARLLGVSNVSARTARQPVPAGARPAPLRPEPLLRRPRLGPRRPRVLRRERDRLPGLLAADREPRGAGPPRTGPDRRTPRPDASPRSSSASPSTSA